MYLSPALHNEGIRALVVSGLVAFRWGSPRTLRVSTGSLAFAATHGVVDRVHSDASSGRTNAEPTVSARFTNRDVFMLWIRNLPDGRTAVRMKKPQFTARKFNMAILVFFSDEL